LSKLSYADESPPMPDRPFLPSQLAELLHSVRTPGDFCTAGRFTMPMPRIQVQGVGPIALPLLPVQAQQLVAIADRAPYGKGGQTLVDTAVRRTWQIGCERLTIEGRHWADSLTELAERAAAGLGVSGKAALDLYKLLVYDEGSFFVSHRDTEKVPGMFATLIVALPSLHAGGELLVRHLGREVRLELQCPDPSEAAYAAFYADCVHEVLPVTSGCRLALVYNLIRPGRGAMPKPPDYSAEQDALAALLQRWSEAKAGNDNDTLPEKLVHLLEHAYTPAGLSFNDLKGADAAAAGVLAAAAAQAGCELRAGLLTIEETGGAYECGPNEFEIVEVDDRVARLSNWQLPDGGAALEPDLPFLDAELSPPGSLDGMEPDDEYFQEATGNEGATFERTYTRAALVLWPGNRRLAVLNQAGLRVTLPLLASLAGQWAASAGGSASPLWQQAHELAGHMLRTWPRFGNVLGPRHRTPVGELLASLARLGDTACIGTCIALLGDAECSVSAGDIEPLLHALACLQARQAAPFIDNLIAAHARENPGFCAELLERAVVTQVCPGGLVTAARRLVDSLPADTPQRVEHFGRREAAVDSGCVVQLFGALVHIDEVLADRAADHLLTWPATYGLDAVIVPALRSLAATDVLRASAAVQRLRNAGLKHLHSRMAQPLAPPADWSRSGAIEGRSKVCNDFNRFMASPAEKSWAYKAAEFERSQVAAAIGQAGCDVDCRTDRSGRPYTLVCTKNQASYERRSAQREQDLVDLALLQ
jgi:hypothetical protein